MFHLHIKTSQERSGHTIMTTDQQRLILINKTTHASEKGLHATKNRKDQQRERKLNLCERRN